MMEEANLAKLFFIAAAAMALLGVLMFLLERHTQKPRSTYTVQHAPAGGCPSGTVLVPGLFKQKDGAAVDGCYQAGPTDFTIDVLNPRESVEFPMIVPLEQHAPPKA